MLIEELMFKRGVADNKVDESGLSRLFMLALRTGSAAAVSAFLVRKAELAATDSRGRSPLIIAAASGHLTICKLLLEAGSDPFARDINGLDASQHARQTGNTELVALLDLAKSVLFEEPEHTGPRSPEAVDAQAFQPEASSSVEEPLTDASMAIGTRRATTELKEDSERLVEALDSAREENELSRLCPQFVKPTGGCGPPAHPFTKVSSSDPIDPKWEPTERSQSPDFVEVVPEGDIQNEVLGQTLAANGEARYSIRVSREMEIKAEHSDPRRIGATFPANLDLHAYTASSFAQLSAELEMPEDAADRSNSSENSGYFVDTFLEGAVEEPSPEGQTSVKAAAVELRPSVEMLSQAPSGAEPEAALWVVDTTTFPIESDRSAVYAAGIIQERLSSAVQWMGGEDWSSIEIDLPDVRSAVSEKAMPDWLIATATNALHCAAALGEFQDEHCVLPQQLSERQDQKLRGMMRQTAAALGCIIDRVPDPWSTALKATGEQIEGPHQNGEAIDAFTTHFWSVGRISAYDARLDAMPRLERMTETDLFRQIAQSTAEAMLPIARSTAAIDFVLSADDLVEEARLPFTFISSLPLIEGAEEVETAREPGNNGDELPVDDASGNVEMVELPAGYVSAIIQLRLIRASGSAFMLPSETREAARALQELALTTDFLRYLAHELAAIDGISETMGAVFIAKRRADQARQTVLERHLPQARALARRYLGRGLELDDLVQEANIGLLRAIETFSTVRGHRFWTYAQAWVWQRLNRAIADLGSTIRLPVHVFQDRRRLELAMARHENFGDRYDAQSLAQSCGLTSQTVQRLLDAWTVDAIEDVEELADEGVAGARLIDELQTDPLASSIENELGDVLRLELDGLSPRMAEIIRLRFGLDDGQALTLEEIGQQYGVTRERIRQIEAKGLKILHHPARSRALRTFLEH